MEPLTKRQKEILEHIRTFVEAQGYAPSLLEIGAHFGLSSPATVHEHLKALAEKGYIERGWNRKRSVVLIDRRPAPEPAGAQIPLLGAIAAGQPIEAVLDQEVVTVPPSMMRAGRRHFALRVQGDSMIDDHIADGDIVVVEAREAANNGETVVALVEGSSATLKRYYREGPVIRLQPANETMAPMRFDETDVRVQGVVVGLLRTF